MLTQEHSFPGPRGVLVCHGRPEGCLLPHPGGSKAQEFPQVYLQGKGLPVQGSSLWASSSPKDVHQVYGCSSGPAEAPGHLNPQLAGRLAYFSQLQGAGDSSQGLLHTLDPRLNGQKSVLTPAQQTFFFGVCLDSTLMQACLAPARVESIKSCAARFKLGRHVSVDIVHRHGI